MSDAQPAALFSVTREIQCDVGHRIPFHKATCSSVHGHRYRIEATLEGSLARQPGCSDDGMVADFGDLKKLMIEQIHDRIDHAFVVWKDDQPLRGFLESQGYRLLVLDTVPTAENLAEWCFSRLEIAVGRQFGGLVRLASVTVWETPNCRATFRRP